LWALLLCNALSLNLIVGYKGYMHVLSLIKRIGLIILFATIFLGGIIVAWELRVQGQPGYHAKKVLVGDTNRVQKALFSPDDDLKLVLIDLIEASKKQISIAAFSITDTDIARALIDAKKRGVRIELVIDRDNSENHYSKVPLLRYAAIPIYIYPTMSVMAQGGRKPLMHNKFIIFDDVLGRGLLWTGSFNFTKQAGTINQENVLVLDTESVVSAYKKHFQVLKGRCDQPCVLQEATRDYIIV
jgi:phosphatidylserine/phosphatidylglycerophosphate/cardiolipin synthase-like enzyme